MSNVYQILLTIIKQAIIDDDIATLKEYLLRLPFEDLKQKVLDNLIATFLNQSVEYNSEKAVKTIISTWYEMVEVETGQLDHLTRLFINNKMTDEALTMVARVYRDEKPIEYYFDYLSNWDSSPNTMIAAKNLDNIFTPDDSVWRYLYNLTVDMENIKGYTNTLIQEFLEMKVRETSPIIIQPEWVNNNYTLLPHNDDLIVPDITPIVYPIPDTLMAIQLMTDGTEDQDYRDYLTSQYSLASTDEKIKILYPFMLSQFRYNLIYDETIFRIYGPSNIMLNADLTTNNTDPCVIHGGCRMFTCVDFTDQYSNGDYADLDADPSQQAYGIIDWFKGSCDFCLNGIQFKHYAVRIPITTGGWLGCFCSWECVEDSLQPSENISLALIPEIKNQLLSIGIQDRSY